MKRNSVRGVRWLLSVALMVALAGSALAAGTLTPRGAPEMPIQIRDHHARIVLNNGFAQVEVTQTFFNPNNRDLEAIYAFPVPKSGSLSEVTIFNGEKEIHGEVVEASEAERVYEEEKSQGNDAGLAKKNSYMTYEFRIAPVRALSEIRLRFVYYQPLEIDHNIGRLIYPLEEGGTDERALSFWVSNEKVEGAFSADIELKSEWPVADVRVPGFEAESVIKQEGEGHYTVRVEKPGASLNRDMVFYYRLQDNLPGRVEMLAYRADASKPGTFMMVVTPGVDLKPITHGADYIFVLDVSGSMEGKLGTLAQGVVKALGELRPQDRFRIVKFSESARDVTGGWILATPENVKTWAEQVGTLRTEGGTNLYDGLAMATRQLDADRATSIILVTDGVTNTGIVEPREFHALMKKYDVRVFGFLMGNSSNWPLMRTIADATGGFYSAVSNSDDIIGQILLAKSKITSEALHDARYTIRGVKTHDATEEAVGKIYRGQQIVIFGRYASGGRAEVTLNARMTGADQTYTTAFDFPDVDTGNPELERLWAMNRIEAIEVREGRGEINATESKNAIQDLGVNYQIVTDYTSMLVLSDESFARHNIDRRNRDRIALERQAQTVRSAQPAQNRRVDATRPAFPGHVPSVGGGALDPSAAFCMLIATVWGIGVFRTNRRRS